MADPLLDLLLSESQSIQTKNLDPSATTVLNKYLSRLLSLRPADLTTTEPQSLSQTANSNNLAIQALSSRSQRSTIASSDQLSDLQNSIPTLTATITHVKASVPHLDESAVNFASTYSRARPASSLSGSDVDNTALSQRKDVMLFSRQADKLQDMLELATLLRTAITSAASGPAGSANYTQALDLVAHIKRLRILYPDSQLIRNVQAQAEEALKDMTKKLINSLQSQHIRLAAAIRTIGWLRRIVPDMSATSIVDPTSASPSGPSLSYTHKEENESEGSLGALFLVARLSAFLAMTEDALAPLRDLADQETEMRLTEAKAPSVSRKSSTVAVQGQQTERYLKRYIEIFREQSFTTIQMYRNVFPPVAVPAPSAEGDGRETIQLPSAVASFPLHLVSLLMDTLETYLPNVTDVAARESLLIQVLYAANSLGRLGADFSMFVSLLDLPETNTGQTSGDGVDESDGDAQEPEWYRVIKKHRVQAARLDALASGQESAARRASQDVAVR